MERKWHKNDAGWPRQWTQQGNGVVVIQDLDENGQPGRYVLACAVDGYPVGPGSGYIEFDALEEAQAAAVDWGRSL